MPLYRFEAMNAQGQAVKNEIEAVLKLADSLNERVVGQRHALEMARCRPGCGCC